MRASERERESTRVYIPFGASEIFAVGLSVCVYACVLCTRVKIAVKVSTAYIEQSIYFRLTYCRLHSRHSLPYLNCVNVFKTRCKTLKFSALIICSLFASSVQTSIRLCICVDRQKFLILILSAKLRQIVTETKTLILFSQSNSIIICGIECLVNILYQWNLQSKRKKEQSAGHD